MTNDEVVNNDCGAEYVPKGKKGDTIHIMGHEDWCRINITTGSESHSVSFHGTSLEVLKKELLGWRREGKSHITLYDEKDRDLPPKLRSGIMFATYDSWIGVGIHDPPVFIVWSSKDMDDIDDIIHAVTGGKE